MTRADCMPRNAPLKCSMRMTGRTIVWGCTKLTGLFIKDREGNQLDPMQPRSVRSMDNCNPRGFQEGWIAIQNPTKEVGVGLAWGPEVFRYVCAWQALGGGIGCRWYGRSLNMGLEPWTRYPCAGLDGAIERGTAELIAPGEGRGICLTATVFTGVAGASLVRQDGTVERSC
jgi:hypothetical protein